MFVPTSFLREKIKGNFLQLVLPNGRPLNYFRPGVGTFTVDIEGYDPFEAHNAYYQGHYGKVAMRGAMFVQNATQAVSRDLLVYSMFNCEAAGIEVIGSVHDEIIMQFLRGTFDKPALLEIMNKTPQWGLDIPVVSEGFISNRYRK